MMARVSGRLATAGCGCLLLLALLAAPGLSGEARIGETAIANESDKARPLGIVGHGEGDETVVPIESAE